MLDGSDAVSDWPLLNFGVGIASGASWMSFHHGGGVGLGFSQHSGLVIVADGTEQAAQKLSRALTNDPGMGVIRHADAGYDHALTVARDRGLDLPASASKTTPRAGSDPAHPPALRRDCHIRPRAHRAA